MKKLFIAQICFVFQNLPSTWDTKITKVQVNKLILKLCMRGISFLEYSGGILLI